MSVIKGKRKKNTLFLGTATYAIGNFGTKILNFLIVPLYTYYIQPADLGDYDLMLTTVSLLSPLLTMKISDAAYRWIIKDQKNEVPYISATYQLLLRNCIPCALTLLLINQRVPVWQCNYFIAILIGDRILECLQKLLRGLKNQILFVVSGLFHTGVLVSANVIKICIRKEGVTALLQSSVVSLYATIVLILLFEKRLRVVEMRVDHSAQQKEMLCYSIPLVPSALSWWVMSASDRYVIRWIIGNAANGIYSVAYKFPSIMQTIFQMFNNAWTDMVLAELDCGEQAEEYAQTVFRQLYKVSFGLVLVMIPLTKFVMNVILSATYREASIYIGFLYLGTIFQGFSSFSSIGYLQGKKTGGAAKTSVYGAVVNFLVNVLLIHLVGLFAAAFSTFAGYLVMWATRMRDIRKVFPIRVRMSAFIPYLLSGIAMSLIVIWTSPVMDLGLSCGMGLFFLADNQNVLKGVLKLVEKRIKR